MSTGPELPVPFRLLLLEVYPGSLAAVTDVWPDVEAIFLPLNQAQGVVDLISREKVGLILCDLHDGGVVGLDVLQQVRRVHPNLPFIMALPDRDFPLALAAFRHGADDVLVHPLTPSDLLRAKEQALAKHRLHRELTQTQLSAERSLDELVLLRTIGETTRSSADLQQLLDRIVDSIQSALDVEIVSLMLAEGDILKISAAYGLPEDVWRSVQIPSGEGISGYVMEHGEAVLIDDLSTDGRFPPRDGVARYRTGSLLSVPIRYHQHILGVLNVNNKRGGEPFSGADQDLLNTIAHQTALAIENLKLVSRLQQKTQEVEQAHSDLMKLHRGRTRFVCNLSHELKTPLTSVLGFSDLLLHFIEQINQDQMNEYISGIHTEAMQLEKLLSGMLRLFSIDSGSENWQWQELSLLNCVEGVLSVHDVSIGEMGLGVACVIPDDLAQVWGSEDKLSLLLDCLIDNAVKFNRPGGHLMIYAENRQVDDLAMVYLQIANQGQAVPLENAGEIFQEYSQLGDLNIGKPSGVGIGLATCTAILRQMCGRIFLENAEEGTCIGVLLPTRQAFEELKNENLSV